MHIAIMLMFVFVSVADAVRDAWVARKAPWWRWHVVKWLAFYTPLVCIIVLAKLSLAEVTVAAISSWVFWRLAYSIALDYKG